LERTKAAKNSKTKKISVKKRQKQISLIGAFFQKGAGEKHPGPKIPASGNDGEG